MFTQFESYIRQQAVVSDEEINLLRSLAVEKTIHRKAFLFQHGEVCRYKLFISETMPRHFSVGLSLTNTRKGAGYNTPKLAAESFAVCEEK
jgi:hypothetical protein